jgi:hypothetical protein
MPRGRKSGRRTTGVSGIAARLESALSGLQQEKQELVRKLAEIDTVFSQLGIQPQDGKRRGRPPKNGQAAGPILAAAPLATAPAAPKAGRRRKRRKFAIPAHESVLQFVKAGGKGGRTSKEIGNHWKEEGRSGQPFITLGQLVKSKKLKKQNMPGVRGSRYAAG